ncbi:Putative transcriptional regulator [Methylobacterium bullatum]|uniref:Transcriptional regulator n=1 Tax=Methylobacterium bullatum TaxID=570505 RepID=A0A679JIL5_9HYPH|nr:Putative transcriptional regulator [Methylobacterium bullatum]
MAGSLGVDMSFFRLLIVDDHPIVLAGLKLLLRGDGRFDVCGEARSAQAACIEAERLQPDVIITDLIMGDGDGLALIEDLRAMLPAARIVVYSSRDETVWGPHVIYAGAHGYVAKSEPLETVAVALDRVMAGAIHVSEPVQQLLMGDLARRRDRRTGIGDLSGRELQVLRLIGSGATLQSLAKELGLSVKTVGTYRERLKIKLGLDSVRMLERHAADHVAGRIDPS